MELLIEDFEYNDRYGELVIEADFIMDEGFNNGINVFVARFYDYEATDDDGEAVCPILMQSDKRVCEEYKQAFIFMEDTHEDELFKYMKMGEE